MVKKRKSLRNNKRAEKKKIDVKDLLKQHSLKKLLVNPLSAEDILENILPKTEKNNLSYTQYVDIAFKLSEELDENYDDLIALWNEEADEYLYYYLPNIFKDAKFLIKLTPEEIENNILFPGHRFIPFVKESILPINVKVMFNDKPLNKTIFKAKFEYCSKFFSLYGFVYLYSCIPENQIDNLKNFNGLNASEIELEFTVFDLGEFCRIHDLSENGRIICTVEDYSEGIVTIDYISADEYEKNEKRNIPRWAGLFEQGLNEAYDILNLKPPPVFLHLTVPFVLYPELLKEPALGVPEFFNLKDTFKIILSVTGEPNILREYESVRDFEREKFQNVMEEVWKSMSNAPDPENASLDELFKFMGFDLSEEELEAYMRDELYHNSKSIQNVINRCLDERVDLDYPDYKELFFDLIEKKWEDICKDYNRFRDEGSGELRSRLLQIRDIHTRWLRNIDPLIGLSFQKGDICDDFKMLAEISGYISNMLAMLNYEQEEDAKHEIQEMVEMSYTLENQINDLIKNVEDYYKKSKL